MYVHVCECALTHGWTKRWGLFFNTLSKALPVERRILGWPPPNSQIWSCHGKNSCIHWMTLIFSLFTQVQWTKQAGSSWGRHFLCLHWQWQTCSNYFKSKQTPRNLPFLLSFVAAFLQAASCFFFFFDDVMCVSSCITNVVGTYFCLPSHIVETCHFFHDKRKSL